MKKRCYIYTRVSTAAQIEGYSLEAQTERLREYADYRELEIAREYCDAGKSGRSIKGRPAFQQRPDDIVCEKDGISFVLVFKLSRFGRNAADVLKSMQLLTDCEVDLVCVEDAIDSSTQGGRLTMAILSAVAEIEKESITAQFLSGKMQKLNEGGWSGGPIPYGYRNINKKLVVEPEEVELVRMVFSLYGQEVMMINSVVSYLNEHGYKKTVRNERRAFTFDMVRTILNNPVYIGKITYGKSTTERVKGTRDEYHRIQVQLKKQLRQVIGVKAKLTDMLDKLDVSDKHYDRKYQDMQDRLYYRLTDFEKKEFLRDFIESVEIYSEKLDNGRMLKQINFNFPVYYDGEVGKEIRLLNENTVECVVRMQRKLNFDGVVYGG